MSCPDRYGRRSARTNQVLHRPEHCPTALPQRGGQPSAAVDAWVAAPTAGTVAAAAGRGRRRSRGRTLRQQCWAGFLAGRQLLAAEILAGRRVGIRIEGPTLLFFDLDTRVLLRTRANPLTMAQAQRLRGARPAGPPPRPSTEPITVQRRASNTGVVMVCGQKIALGRVHRHQTVTIHVADTTLAVELDDGETRVVRRTTTLPVRNIKADRPWTDHAVS